MRVETIESASILSSTIVPAVVEARTRISLAFRVNGFIAKFHVDEGDRVAIGDLLAELDLSDLERDKGLARARLDSAIANADEAERDLTRSRHLAKTKAIARERLDASEARARSARASLTEARLQLDAAKDRLSKGRLVSPIDGLVESRLIEEHEHAQAGRATLVLTDIETLKLRAAIPDSSLDLVSVDKVVRIRSRARGGIELDGRVKHLGVSADPKTRSLPFEVAVSNDGLALRPEMVVDVILESGSGKSILSVPLTAVLRGADLEAFCFVFNQSSNEVIAERSKVTLGSIINDRIEIVAGLESGQQVIVRGQHLLSEGDRVRIATD